MAASSVMSHINCSRTMLGKILFALGRYYFYFASVVLGYLTDVLLLGQHFVLCAFRISLQNTFFFHIGKNWKAHCLKHPALILRNNILLNYMHCIPWENQ